MEPKWACHNLSSSLLKHERQECKKPRTTKTGKIYFPVYLRASQKAGPVSRPWAMSALLTRGGKRTRAPREKPRPQYQYPGNLTARHSTKAFCVVGYWRCWLLKRLNMNALLGPMLTKSWAAFLTHGRKTFLGLGFINQSQKLLFAFFNNLIQITL